MSEYDDLGTSNGVGSSPNNAHKIDVESNISKEYGKEQKIREYRKEANRLVSLANKRIRRLEKNGLQSSPAYQAYLANGGKPFSVKGKDYNQLQSEVARLRRFIDSQTSTVKGVNNYLKDIAKNTGIKYKNLTELRQKADKFFELSSKIEQYLRQVEDIASAIGYQKIWESINVYVKDNRLDLSDSNLSIDDMVVAISKAIADFDNPIHDKINVINDDIWFVLAKD